jgi:hypothetical protein
MTKPGGSRKYINYNDLSEYLRFTESLDII